MKTAGREIPKGYKQTEVGVIPEDWNVSSLGKLFSFGGGYTASRDQLSEDGLCYLHYGDIHGSNKTFIDAVKEYHEIPKLNIPINKVSAKSRLSEGDVVFVDASEDDEGASRHIVVRNSNEIPYISGLHTIVAKSKDDSLDNRYKQFCFQAASVKKQFKYYAVGTKVSGISKANIVKIQIPLPKKPEQSTIAAILSDTDELIENIEKLIAKKRALKQGAMQALLTGKRRLPGFSGEWELSPLSQLGTFSKGKGIRKDEVVSEGLPCIRYGEIYTTHNDFIRAFSSFITVSVAMQSQRINKGDLLFAGSGETSEEIGKCVAYLGEEEAYAGGDIVIFTPYDQDSAFLGYLMNYKVVQDQKAKLGQGDAVVHISASNLGKLQLLLPKPQEQSAIARVITDIDAENDALEQMLSKYKMIKIGMMRNLLTGKIRVYGTHN